VLISSQQEVRALNFSAIDEARLLIEYHDGGIIQGQSSSTTLPCFQFYTVTTKFSCGCLELQMAIDFLPSQIGTQETVSLPYTGSPLQLLWSDIVLFFQCARFLPGIVFPWMPWRSGKLDELFPSYPNLVALTIHAFLIVGQLGFLISLPGCCLAFPLSICVLYMSVVIFVNSLICRTLNGSKKFLESQVPISARPEHEEEHWIFINGVAVG
jgi:hypothetical protein